MPEIHPPHTEEAVRVLLTAEQIQGRVREMGLELARDYWGTRPLLVAVLKGAAMFVSDLARSIPMEVELDFLSVSSYGLAGTARSGSTRLVYDVRGDVAGRNVILVEGVVDTGHSLSFILDVLRSRRPASLKVCALLDKAPCRRVPVPMDYVGFRVGAEFLVGYGLDVAEHHRNLPYVGVLQEPETS